MDESTVSYWNKTAGEEHFPRLEHSIETDILIIGGGITGITCAYCLALKGAKPVLIEASELCSGTTGNTTGKVTIQHDFIYSKIMDKYGSDFAKLYAESQTGALNFVKDQVKKKKSTASLPKTRPIFSLPRKMTGTSSNGNTALPKSFTSMQNILKAQISLRIISECLGSGIRQ